MPLKFLHTADLQIGMTATGAGSAAAELQKARIKSLENIIRIARNKKTDFVVIAGDLFESNRVSKKIRSEVAGIFEKAKPLKFYILPGNHDCYDESSVYKSDEFRDLGDHVIIFTEDAPLTDTELDLTFYPGVCKELHSTKSPASWIKQKENSAYHIAVLHGSIPDLIGRSGKEDSYYPMTVAELESLNMDYIALGHWHSVSPDPADNGDSPFYYSGTPEPTGFGERMSGSVLLVELEQGNRIVENIDTGEYRFLDLQPEIRSETDLEKLKDQVTRVEDPAKTMIRLCPKGVVSMEIREAIEDFVNDIEERVLHVRFMDEELTVEPSESDLERFVSGGIAEKTFSLLKSKMEHADEQERKKFERAISLAYRAFTSG